MPHDLRNREIFAVGTWNNMKFTTEDLDDIASNFKKLRKTHKVPLKFGHDADHKDGQPAIGWISDVFRKGDKLFADFADMPRVVFEAIKNKLYRTVSVEVLFGVDKEGTRFNHVLDAVALLGADKPAVSGLADLDALLASRSSFTGGHKLVFETIAGKGKLVKLEEDDMTPEEIQKLVDNTVAAAVEPLQTANVKLTQDLKASNDKLAVLESEKKQKEEDETKASIKLSRDNVNEVLDSAVKAGSCTPAFRETYGKQIGLDDDERVIKIEIDEVRKMFSVKAPDQKPTGFESKEDEFDNPEDELHQRTMQCMAESGEADFAAAFSRTCAANPKLHKAYLDMNGEV